MDGYSRKQKGVLTACALAFAMTPGMASGQALTPLHYVVVDGKWYEAPPPAGATAWVEYIIPTMLIIRGSQQSNCRRTNGQAMVPSQRLLMYGQFYQTIYLGGPQEYEWYTVGNNDVMVLRMTSSSGDVICDNALTAEPIPGNRADLSVTLTDSSDPVTPGTAFSYTATIHNAGPNPAQAPRVLFAMPVQATYSSASGAGWTCSRAGVQVTCDRASVLAVGGSASVQLHAVSPTTAGVTLQASATVSSGTIDPNNANNTSTQSTTVSGAAATADLAITMTDNHDPVVASTAFAYTLDVQNHGPSTAANVAIEYTIPGALTYGSASGNGWNCTLVNRKLTCTRPSLASGAQSAVVVSVTAPGVATTISNTAKVSSATADAVTANNTATQTTQVVYQTASADMAIAIATPSPLEAGSDYAYVIGVSNYGPMATTNVTVLATLPPGVSYRNFGGSGWVCQPPVAPSRTITCTRANSLASGASAPLVIEVKAPATGGAVTFTAEVRSARADAQLQNNTQSVTHTITGGSSGGGGNDEYRIFIDGFEEYRVFCDGFDVTPPLRCNPGN